MGHTLPLTYEILKLPLFRQLTINFSLACELLLSQINAQPQLLSQLFPLQKNSADTRKKIWLTEEAFIRQKPIHFLKITAADFNPTYQAQGQYWYQMKDKK